MPPMITTTREFSNQFASTPGARLAKEPPIAPPMPASAEPTTKATAKVNWMLMPIAETMSRSSTPARMTMPVRVRLSQNHSAAPIARPMPRMTRRVSVYCTSPTWKSTNLSKVPGQEMSCATPPKWASIWSARMIEMAMVMSAWRRSSPWFQRRKNCCINSRCPPPRRRRPAAAGTTA
jgi:hypothetical protein